MVGVTTKKRTRAAVMRSSLRERESQTQDSAVVEERAGLRTVTLQCMSVISCRFVA